MVNGIRINESLGMNLNPGPYFLLPLVLLRNLQVSLGLSSRKTQQQSPYFGITFIRTQKHNMTVNFAKIFSFIMANVTTPKRENGKPISLKKPNPKRSLSLSLIG